MRLFSLLVLGVFASGFPALPAHAQQSLDPELAAQIEGLEYCFSSPGPNRWTAPNREQGLRSKFHGGALELTSRTPLADGKDPVWKLDLRTVSFGRVGHMQALSHRASAARGARIELDHGPVLEWFINQARGIEQGWTIAEKPSGDGALSIGLSLGGAYSLRVGPSGRSGVFHDSEGQARLGYEGLVAWDALGQDLAVKLVSTAHGFEVQVDDRTASYPITVDPVIVQPSWIWIAPQPITQAGFSVSSAGDINRDGYADVLVGAPLFDSGNRDEGNVFLFLGSPTGLEMEIEWVGESNLFNAQLGASVASAGDVNGDGYADIIVSAPQYTNGELQEGAVYVFLGTSTGLEATASWIIESNQFGAGRDSNVAGAGDVNGDGYDDVLVGNPFYDNGLREQGQAQLFLGSATGLSNVPDWSIESGQLTAQFGTSVAGAGDVNGDGFDDIIIGCLRCSSSGGFGGSAALFLGSSTGPSSSADWTTEPDQATGNMGASVAGAGDVNGDGFDDVIVGAPNYSNGESREGAAFVYLGTSTGLEQGAVWNAESNQVNANFGDCVSSADDANGDGFDDVVVGAPNFDSPLPQEGRIFVYTGSSMGLGSVATWTAEANRSLALFGSSVASAGDVNGDGFSDLIVGAHGKHRVFAYRGFATPAASGTIQNGAGTNPACFSTSPPVLGTNWNSTVDMTVRSSPSFAWLGVYAQGGSGLILAGGELLIDLNSLRYLSVLAPANGPTASFSLAVPTSLSFLGLTANAQVFVFGGGYTLCNGYSFTLGF